DTDVVYHPKLIKLFNISSESTLLFFFQAEDGIRDRNVTGVQTCALPISFFALYGDVPRFSCTAAGGSALWAPLTAAVSGHASQAPFRLCPPPGRRGPTFVFLKGGGSYGHEDRRGGPRLGCGGPGPWPRGRAAGSGRQRPERRAGLPVLYRQPRLPPDRPGGGPDGGVGCGPAARRGLWVQLCHLSGGQKALLRQPLHLLLHRPAAAGDAQKPVLQGRRRAAVLFVRQLYHHDQYARS